MVKKQELLRLENIKLMMKTSTSWEVVLEDVNLVLYDGEITGIFAEFNSRGELIQRLITGDLDEQKYKLQTGKMYVKGTEVNPLTSFYKEQKTKQTITYLASNTHNYANTKAKDILIPIIRSSSEGRRLSYQQVYMLVYKFISQNSVLDTSFVLERKYKDLTQPEKIIVDVFVALLSTSEVIVVPDFISDVSQTDQLSILTLIASYISWRKKTLLIASKSLKILSQISNNIGIVYEGKIIEYGKAREITHNSRHPYTWSSLLSEQMYDMIGKNYHQSEYSTDTVGDSFTKISKYSTPLCAHIKPPVTNVSSTHWVYYWATAMKIPMPKPMELKQLILKGEVF